MAKASKPNPSLWWRLSWQLSLVITTVIAAVIVGLSIHATIGLSPNFAKEREIKLAVANAITRGSQGRLELQDTLELRSLTEQIKGLWFVAATSDGASVSQGTVPAPYDTIAPLVHFLKSADIRGADGVTEIASIIDVETSLGDVRIMFGGVAGKGWLAPVILAETYPLYVFLLAFALPAIFIAVPRIVKRALTKISDVARKASQIEPRRHDARLPIDGIPAEVAPLVVAFNGVLDRLESEFRKRQRFLIDAAHELRTPIAIMQTRIDGMAEGGERRRLLGDVARLAETAEQLLDFERNDQASDINDTVDLVAIARAAVADLAPVAIAAGYEISFQSDVESLLRKGSPSALPRAIINLIRNAIDHGGNRGMISVYVSAEGEIRVSDDGPGIPPEHQELVFEAFYRVVPKSKGAGLGLSLVKQVVSNHDGQVSLESVPNRTTVSIHL